MPLGNRSKILLRTPYLMCSRFELNDKSLFPYVLIVYLFVYAVDHGVNEGEPVSEQCCEQVNEDPFRDPEPEGQDIPESFEDGKFNPIL